MFLRLWLLACLGLLAATTGSLAEDPRDPRYFHHRGSGSGAYVVFSDASLQAKGVAASRRVPLVEMRQWLAGHVEHPDGHPNLQVIDVAGLNGDLDRQFPWPGH